MSDISDEQRAQVYRELAGMVGDGGCFHREWFAVRADELDPPMHTYTVRDSPKMLRETLCVAQGWVNRCVSDTDRRQEHSDRLHRLIAECDRKRPLGQDGKHGGRHTDECGCADA